MSKIWNYAGKLKIPCFAFLNAFEAPLIWTFWEPLLILMMMLSRSDLTVTRPCRKSSFMLVCQLERESFSVDQSKIQIWLFCCSVFDERSTEHFIIMSCFSSWQFSIVETSSVLWIDGGSGRWSNAKEWFGCNCYEYGSSTYRRRGRFRFSYVLIPQEACLLMLRMLAYSRLNVLSSPLVVLEVFQVPAILSFLPIKIAATHLCAEEVNTRGSPSLLLNVVSFGRDCWQPCYALRC